MINRNIAAQRLPAREIIAVTTCACILFAHASRAQSDAAALPLFADTTTLELTLEAPLRALRRDSRARPERDGFIRYTDAAGNEVELDVEVRVRGNSRLAQCDFPPLRLDLRRGQLDETVFAGQNRLKLVTLCKARDTYRDYLHLEHDIYKLFNALSDYSFRVRRANVHYISTDSRREETFTEPAFLIEEDWEVAARHSMELLELERAELDSLNAEHTALVSVFHFLIGNTDWSALQAAPGDDCCHNGALIAGPGGAGVVLPYDFDQSGLINTEYSQPSAQLSIRNVRQRLYRGFCRLNAQAEHAADLMVDRRDALAGILGASLASEPARAEALAYLSESLDLLANNDARTANIQEKCR